MASKVNALQALSTPNLSHGCIPLVFHSYLSCLACLSVWQTLLFSILTSTDWQHPALVTRPGSIVFRKNRRLGDMDTRLPQPRAFHTFSSLSLFFALSLILISPQLAQGQQCYYPNGNLSPNDVPCSSESGSACCPNGWECLSNGLCYLPNEAYLGRYTCTDSNWQSVCRQSSEFAIVQKLGSK